MMHNKNFTALSLILLLLASLACQIGTVQDEPDVAESDGGVLFSDDFSDPDSGWDRYEDPDGLTDYDQGQYRIVVNQPNFDFWANPGLTFSDVQVSVSATKSSGPDENDYGVICRYLDVNNFYFFIIGSDGYYGIGKVADGEQQLVGMEEMQFTNVINQGGSTNEIQAECVGETLTLSVNGQVLADVRDSDFSTGDVGLIAGTFEEPGTNITFDDFLVRRP
jgi:hypothetical protein